MSTQLFVRSVFTLLSSMCTIKGLVSKAREYGYKAVALTDRNVLSGAMAFKKECEKQGIKAIYGLEIETELDERVFSCVLYAKNDDGYRNLMGLSSHINTVDKKVVDTETLNRYRSNNYLVLLSDDMPLTYAVDKNEDCEACFRRQQEVFGEYLVGLMDHNIAINARRDLKIKQLCREHGIKTLALSRTFYPEKDDYREYEILKCIRDKRILEDNAYYDEGRHFLDKDEFSSLYEEDDLKNTDVLASLCNVRLDYHTSLPEYPTPEGVLSKDYLIALCREGLKRRLKGRQDREYSRRLEYELKTIIDMHFEDYFLIVYDFILYAKRNGILVGPGRGSAAGSLVSYCLGITDIDPIKYGLLFERFLNPERISMPDIDTDFPDDRRDEMFTYVRDKYGKDHVGHIVTYGTLKTKQVLRDVGRVLTYSTAELDLISKAVPFSYNMTLRNAYDSSPLFRQRIESQQKYRDLYNICLKLEGFPRHESTHAAGVVMSSKVLEEVVPMIRVETDINSTQYTMEHLEDLGLIKMDFLGLRNLGIIAEIVDDIKKNAEPDFDLKSIPLDDEKTFRLIDDVNLLGVFQLESNGMQNLARKMKPRTFEELGMMIALFRPGPMDNIPLFLENRANPGNIHYLVPALMPILEETYGIIVYQEQIMTIARVLAGFTYGKADILRRAMSKKKAEELERLQNDFIEGCVNNGYERNVAAEIYELVLKFANYGFNKSHSIAYAMVAYQLAYLKANYPKYFYKALLNGVIGSETKTYEYIKECRDVGQKVEGISINRSVTSYIIEGDAIIMPLGVCKDVGNVSAVKIIEERKENGPFSDFVSCVSRLTGRGVEKNVIENLIYAGAFDEFKESRYTMINALPNILKYVGSHKGEISLMADLDDAPIIEKLKDDMQVRAENERKVLGFYFSFNPIEEVKKRNGIDVPSLKQLLETAGYVKGFGMIRRVKTHRTKKGDMMAFVDISDDSGDLSLVVMPNLYNENQAVLVKENYLYFEGNMEKEASLLVKKLRKV